MNIKPFPTLGTKIKMIFKILNNIEAVKAYEDQKQAFQFKPDIAAVDADEDMKKALQIKHNIGAVGADEDLNADIKECIHFNNHEDLKKALNGKSNMMRLFFHRYTMLKCLDEIMNRLTFTKAEATHSLLEEAFFLEINYKESLTESDVEMFEACYSMSKKI